MKIKISITGIFIFLGLTVLHLILSTAGTEKYVAVLGLALLVLILGLRKKLSIDAFILLLPPLFYSVYGVIIGSLKGNLGYYSFKQIAFYLVPILAAIFFYEFLNRKAFERILYIQFWSIIIAFIVTNYLKASAENTFESQYAFIFGAYTLFYLYRGQYKHSIFAMVLTILANKRITILAVIICAAALILLRAFNERKQALLVRLSFFAAIAFVYIYVYNCLNGNMAEIMYQYKINSQGRIEAWDLISKYCSFGVGYLGLGIGWVLHQLSVLQIGGFENLHNDMLAAYIELGFTGFGLWIALHYIVVSFFMKKSFKRENACAIGLLYLYTFINYCTDNISIYISYWLPLYIIILYISDIKHEYE